MYFINLYKDKILPLLNKMPSWLKVTLIVIVSFEMLHIIDGLFRKYTLVVFLLWLSIPLVFAIGGATKYGHAIGYKIARKVQICTIIFVVTIGFIFFANYNMLRDNIGKKYVEGYYSEYYEYSDEYGRPSMGVTVSTKHWYTRILLWAGEWGFMLLIFGIPYLTYVISDSYVDYKRSDEEHKRYLEEKRQR